VTRYSGHSLSRLAVYVAQHSQTNPFSSYMREVAGKDISDKSVSVGLSFGLFGVESGDGLLQSVSVQYASTKFFWGKVSFSLDRVIDVNPVFNPGHTDLERLSAGQVLKSPLFWDFDWPLLKVGHSLWCVRIGEVCGFNC